MSDKDLSREAVARLRKMLALEAARGFDNRAVNGGLGAYAPHWLRQAGEAPFAMPVADLLRQYDDAAAPERRRLVADLVARFDGGHAPGPVRLHDDALQVWPPADPAEPAERRQSSAAAGPPARQVIGPIGREVHERANSTSAGIAPRPTVAASRSAGVGAPRRPARSSRGQPLTLDSPITSLSGIKGASASKLKKLGVETARDLLFLFPHRHIDYSDVKPIRDLVIGETATVAATVFEIDNPRQTARGHSMTRVTLADHTGTAVATWFNQRYIGEQLQIRQRIYVSGKVGLFGGRPAFSAPEWEPIADPDQPQSSAPVHTGRLTPVYPLTGDLKQRWLRARMAEVVPRFAPMLVDHLPASLRVAEGLLELGAAVERLHFPRASADRDRARDRLAFDELFMIQLGLLHRRREARAEPGIIIMSSPDIVESVERLTPYQLTGAQRRVIAEVLADMASGAPMTRLMQGDVGSGKTVVAATAALVAARAGYQTTIMAPTEILAEQHFRSIGQVFGQPEELPLLAAPEAGSDGGRLRVALLTGSTTKSTRQRTLDRVMAGEVDLLIGTHALIQEGVEFARLGLAVVDEQHRFGVAQRGALRSRGQTPHLLVMTATPIPRTLALTIYGDLDTSIIDEMPPGRQVIKTRLVGPERRQQAYDFVRKRVAAGEQAFVICPLVEESEKIEAKAATVEFDRLRTEVFPELAERMGLLHGRLAARDKAAVMTRFRANELAILVATAVVEVGVDVPNATVMVIEGADRFGLAQLHQFRGRVGRGEKQSYCVLIAESGSPDTERRLRAMEETEDGFKLAEVDLEIRGPGEVFGARQSGLPDLKVASLADTRLLQRARSAADSVLDGDPTLTSPENALLRGQLMRMWLQASQAG